MSLTIITSFSTQEAFATVKKPTITETIMLQDYVGLDMYREWKKIEFPKEYYI
jgi:hypothetical protein